MNEHKKELEQPSKIKITSIRSQTLGQMLLRGGVIGASFFSIISLVGVRFLLKEYYSKSIILRVFIILSFLITYFLIIVLVVVSSIFLLSFFKKKDSNLAQMKQIGKNIQIYIVLSLILTDWTFLQIPGFVFLPLTQFDSVFGILYFHQRGWVFPYSGDLHASERVGDFPSIVTFIDFYLGSTDWNIFLGLIRLIGIGLFLFTIGYLIYRMVFLIKNKEKLKVKYSNLLYFFELEFTILVLGLLIFEMLPLWEFFDSKAYLVILIFDFIYLFISPHLALFLINFLMTGDLAHPFFLINNFQQCITRFRYSIVLPSLTSVIVWILYLLPIYFHGRI